MFMIKNDYSCVKTITMKQERPVKVIQWTGDNFKKIKKLVKSISPSYRVERAKYTSITLVDATLPLCYEGGFHIDCQEVRLCDFIVCGFCNDHDDYIQIFSEAEFKKNILKLLKDRD